jgi:hypothetical protein
MRITTGHVIHGLIVLDDYDEPLPEGAEITIGIPEQVEEVELTAEQLAELDAAVAEIEAGKGIPAEEVLRRLREVR